MSSSPASAIDPSRSRRSVLNVNIEDFKQGMEKFAKMFSSNYGVRLIFRGTSAYTDGKTIVVPELSLLSRPNMTEEEVEEALNFLMCTRGFVYHEGAHIIFTNDLRAVVREASKVGAKFQYLFNALEDLRIESRISEVFPGAREALVFMNAFLTEEIAERFAKEKAAGKPPSLFAQIVHALMLIGTLAGNGTDSTLWNVLSKEAREWAMKCRRFVMRAKNGHSSRVAYNAAKEIWALLKEEEERRKAEKEAKEAGDGEGKGEEDAEEGESSSKKKKKKPKKKEDDDEDDADSVDDADGSGDDDGGDATDESEPGGDDEEGDGADGDAGRGDDGDEDDSAHADGDDDDLDLGDDEDDDAGAEDLGGGEADTDGKEGAEAAGPSSPGEGEEAEGPLGDPSGDDKPITKEDVIEHKMRDEVERLLTSGESTYRVYSTENDRIAPPEAPDERTLAYHKAAVKKLDEETRFAYGPVKRQLENQLKARTHSYYVRGLDEGELDPGNLHRLAVASGASPEYRQQAQQVFMQKVQVRSLHETVCMLSIDCSGSMNGGGYGATEAKYQLAKKCAIVFAQALSGVNVPFGIYGWTSAPHGTSDSTVSEIKRHALKTATEQKHPNPTLYVEERVREAQRLYTRFGGLDITIVKSFEERWDPNAWRLNYIQGKHANYDGESVLWGARQLMARPEKRKVLFVMCDGIPGPDFHEDDSVHAQYLRDVVKEIRTTTPVEIVGIGIGAPAAGAFYNPQFVNVTNVSELPTVVTKQLKRVLLT